MVICLQYRFLKNALQVSRNLFGFTVNYVDWSDFIIHCMELPYPSIDELLILKKKCMAMERKRKTNDNENHIDGTAVLTYTLTFSELFLT